MIERIGAFISYFESVRRRTITSCKAIPDEQIDWAPRPDEMSFGDLIRHLAELGAARPQIYGLTLEELMVRTGGV
ncbi:MAG: DinB family protein [Chloroflexales bacterium]|nr:DinB family protein [Chloroflexales bacterium]